MKGPEVQPLLIRINFLWHDMQLLLQGPVVRLLHLHYAQRWSHSFTQNPKQTRAIEIRIPQVLVGREKEEGGRREKGEEEGGGRGGRRREGEGVEEGAMQFMLRGGHNQLHRTRSRQER
jgi:phosphatidylserine/phosphatidylglycerophosphate/cardiolipin synthase-like enzyme